MHGSAGMREAKSQGIGVDTRFLALRLQSSLLPKCLHLRDEFRNAVHELLSPDVFPLEIGHALTKVDDLPLLLGFLTKLHLPRCLDLISTPHPPRQGLSQGWIITLRTTCIRSHADHRKV